MAHYDRKILNKLLDTYENSSLYQGVNKINVQITINITKRFLPEYFDTSSTEYDVFHEQMQALEEAGFIQIIWKNRQAGHIIQKVRLETERTGEIYKELGRTPRRSQEKTLEGILEEFHSCANPILQNFISWIRMRISEGKSVQEYMKKEEPKECRNLLVAVSNILENDKEMFTREFSIRYFHDSKYFQKISSRTVSVIRRFSDETSTDYQEMTKEQILEEYNLFENPSCVMIKGNAHLRLAGSEIILERLQGGLGILSQDLQKIEWDVNCPVKRVLTIENLTVFHRWREPDTLIVYLGGYHNGVKRQFLKGLYRQYPNSGYYHFGDIDCGGYWIYWDLCQKTGIPFQTYKMDVQTLECFQEYGKELTAMDVIRLEQMRKEERFLEFHEVFDRMLHLQQKLEQECVFIND